MQVCFFIIIFLYSQIWDLRHMTACYDRTVLHASTSLNYNMPSTNDSDNCGMTQLNGKFSLSFVSIILIYLFLHLFSFYNYDTTTCHPRMTGWWMVDHTAQTTIHIIWANGKYFFISIILICLFGSSFLVSTTTILHLQTMGWRMVGWQGPNDNTCNLANGNYFFLFFFCFYHTYLLNLYFLQPPHTMTIHKWWDDDDKMTNGRPFFLFILFLLC